MLRIIRFGGPATQRNAPALITRSRPRLPGRWQAIGGWQGLQWRRARRERAAWPGPCMSIWRSTMGPMPVMDGIACIVRHDQCRPQQQKQTNTQGVQPPPGLALSVHARLT
jgi:hypothetical protein